VNIFQEMVYCAIWSFFFLIAACVLAADASYVAFGGAWAIASVNINFKN